MYYYGYLEFILSQYKIQLLAEISDLFIFSYCSFNSSLFVWMNGINFGKIPNSYRLTVALYSNSIEVS